MTINGHLLSRAKARLDAMRAENEKDYASRRKEAFAANPRIEELTSMMSSTVADAIGNALLRGGDTTEAIDSLRELNLSLQEERARALVASGFPPDYLEETYMCPKCHDTGYLKTGPCECLMKLYREEQKKELGSRLDLGSETFDSFDPLLYDDAPDPVTGISPRANMEMVYEACVEYARKFGPESLNLFFIGGTGLGKTFLSTCIAKVVSENGFSVVYETAGSIFSKYEDEQFSRVDDMAALRSEIRAYETCDLLIVDDLGTEFSTSFITSALYRLINTRLTSGKKTIISSNFTFQELRSRYSGAVMSRLEGEFTVLPFYGRDIRLIKKDR